MKKWIVFVLSLLVIGCGREKIDKEKFWNLGKFYGYIMENNNYGYEKYLYIKNVYYAINRENAYNIQFLELESDDYAHDFFLINKTELEKIVDNNTYVKRKNYSNYELYHLENDSDYMLIIRDMNNILYLNAPIEYFDEIEEFLNALNLVY